MVTGRLILSGGKIPPAQEVVVEEYASQDETVAIHIQKEEDFIALVLVLGMSHATPGNVLEALKILVIASARNSMETISNSAEFPRMSNGYQSILQVCTLSICDVLLFMF